MATPPKDLPLDDGEDVPVRVRVAEPHYFGIGAPVFVFSVAVLLLALAVVLLVFGRLLLGGIALALALALVPSFLAGARRWPEGSVARVGMSTADRVRDEADVAADSISTWSRAGRDLLQLRSEQFTLGRDLDEKIHELGTSVFEDDGRADALKAEAKELDRRLQANERELSRIVAAARKRVRGKRAAIVTTEVIKPDEGPEPPPS